MPRTILVLTLATVVLLTASFLALIGIRGVISGDPNLGHTAALIGAIVIARAITLGD